MDWYKIVPSDERVSQGDLLVNCPLLGSRADEDGCDLLEEPMKEDVLVVTQDCDLEQGKTEDVLLCFCLPLSRFKEDWRRDQEAQHRSTKEERWGALCGNISKGYTPNVTMLDPFESESLSTEHRVVVFNKAYLMPLDYIQAELKQRNEPRLRLVSPFREHIAQSFARCYMRVPLPDNRPKAW
jgi:hypothetical protein